MSTAFGEDAGNIQLPFVKDGIVTQRPLGLILRDLFMQLAFKNIRYEILFVPILAMFFYRKSDRELLVNIKTVR